MSKIPNFDTEQSSYRANLLEHLFIAELLQEAVLRRGFLIDVLRTEVDNSGFDLVLVAGKVTRFVQFKTSSGKTSKQKVSTELAGRQGWCVIWIECKVNEGRGRYDLTYRFHGSPPEGMSSLPPHLRVALHTKGDATGTKKERPKHRVLNKGDFVLIKGGISELLTVLFGDNP